MLNKFGRLIITAIGMLIGAGIALIISELRSMIPGLKDASEPVCIAVFVACIIITGIIFYILAPALQRAFKKAAQVLDVDFQKVPTNELIVGIIGLFVGLLLAFLISQLWRDLGIPLLGTLLSIVVYAALGYLGYHIANKRADELTSGFRALTLQRGGISRGKGKSKGEKSVPKILDTSVIIDGRIADIMKTGFIEGPIVIPEFVLVELRHIADSSDALKRNRGRRGLDVLNRIQNQYGIEIYNTENEKALKGIEEVDVKLLELASSMKGKVVTNDFNLNKVAAIKEVPVLNINELANTLKPVVLPGEEMKVTPVKDGREKNQALAYLDDGTMIVVEDGKRYIGEEIPVIATSVLQTSAGRMIFAKYSGSISLRK